MHRFLFDPPLNQDTNNIIASYCTYVASCCTYVTSCCTYVTSCTCGLMLYVCSLMLDVVYTIPVGVSILILYTRTGSTSLPSSQVFGVHTVYQTETVCLGSGCGPIPKPIPMHTRISYVDLTQGPAEVLKSITDIQGHLPEDFFIPSLLPAILIQQSLTTSSLHV